MTLPGLAKSQVWQDSLFVNPHSATIYGMTLLRHGLSDSAGKPYGRVGLNYNSSTGNYRRAQEAYTKNNVTFFAEGINRINRVAISGNFTFDKSFEDSLANSLRSDLDPLSPFYHYASKANKFERQNYIANVTVSYDLLPGKLMPFVNVNYRTHWTTASVDPRPEVKAFVLKYNPGLSYRTKSGSIFSVMGIFGRSDESTNISYKNINFQESLLFPERIQYLNFGYGYFSIQDTSRIKRHTDHIGAELTFKKKLGTWDLLSYLRTERSYVENTHGTRSRKEYFVRAKFILNEYSGRLLFTKTGNTHDQQLDIEAQMADGYDGHSNFSADLSKVNYEVSQSSLRMAYSLIFNKQKQTKQELGITVLYNDERRADAAQSTELDAKQLSITALYRSYFAYGKNNMLIAKAAPFYIFPLETFIAVNPNSVNAFTRNVVYTDYYYFGSKLAGATAGLSWVSNNLLKKNILEFSADLQYTHKLNDPPVTYSPGFMPDKYRMHANIGVKLFF